MKNNTANMILYGLENMTLTVQFIQNKQYLCYRLPIYQTIYGNYQLIWLQIFSVYVELTQGCASCQALTFWTTRWILLTQT